MIYLIRLYHPHVFFNICSYDTLTWKSPYWSANFSRSPTLISLSSVAMRRCSQIAVTVGIKYILANSSNSRRNLTAIETLKTCSKREIHWTLGASAPWINDVEKLEEHMMLHIWEFNLISSSLNEIWIVKHGFQCLRVHCQILNR